MPRGGSLVSTLQCNAGRGLAMRVVRTRENSRNRIWANRPSSSAIGEHLESAPCGSPVDGVSCKLFFRGRRKRELRYRFGELVDGIHEVGVFGQIRAVGHHPVLQQLQYPVITVHECEHMSSTERVRSGVYTACAGDDSTSCLLLSGSCRSYRRNWVRHQCKNAVEADWDRTC